MELYIFAVQALMCIAPAAVSSLTGLVRSRASKKQPNTYYCQPPMAPSELQEVEAVQKCDQLQFERDALQLVVAYSETMVSNWQARYTRLKHELQAVELDRANLQDELENERGSLRNSMCKQQQLTEQLSELEKSKQDELGELRVVEGHLRHEMAGLLSSYLQLQHQACSSYCLQYARQSLLGLSAQFNSSTLDRVKAVWLVWEHNGSMTQQDQMALPMMQLALPSNGCGVENSHWMRNRNKAQVGRKVSKLTTDAAACIFETLKLTAGAIVQGWHSRFTRAYKVPQQPISHALKAGSLKTKAVLAKQSTFAVRFAGLRISMEKL